MFLVTLLLSAAPAFACSIAGPEEFVLDPQSDDQVAPEMPVIADVAITRGRGPQEGRGGQLVSTSCDDLGFIGIDLEDTKDDVGYLFDLVEGELPDGLVLPEEAWIGPELTLVWIDEAVDKQDAFYMTLEITAVDRAGNLSEPVPVVIEDDGIPPQPRPGCNTAPMAPLGSLVLLAGLAAVVRRREP